MLDIGCGDMVMAVRGGKPRTVAPKLIRTSRVRPACRLRRIGGLWNDRFCRKAAFDELTSAQCHKRHRPALLDHLVGPVEQRRHSRFVWFDRMTPAGTFRL